MDGYSKSSKKYDDSSIIININEILAQCNALGVNAFFQDIVDKAIEISLASLLVYETVSSVEYKLIPHEYAKEIVDKEYENIIGLIDSKRMVTYVRNLVKKGKYSHLISILFKLAYKSNYTFVKEDFPRNVLNDLRYLIGYHNNVVSVPVRLQSILIEIIHEAFIEDFNKIDKLIDEYSSKGEKLVEAILLKKEEFYSEYKAVFLDKDNKFIEICVIVTPTIFLADKHKSDKYKRVVIVSLFDSVSSVLSYVDKLKDKVTVILMRAEPLVIPKGREEHDDFVKYLLESIISYTQTDIDNIVRYHKMKRK